MQLLENIGLFILNCLPGGGYFLYKNKIAEATKIMDEAENIVCNNTPVVHEKYVTIKSYNLEDFEFIQSLSDLSNSEIFKFFLLNLEMTVLNELKQPMSTPEVEREKIGILKGIEFVRVQLNRYSDMYRNSQAKEGFDV